MKNVFKIICIASVSCFFFSMDAFADEYVTVGGLRYRLNGTEAKACGCVGTPTNIVIPSQITYNGQIFNVKEVTSQAFNNCNTLVSVTGEGITTINYWAFKNCKSLVSISFPNVEIIGTGAFVNCNNLTKAYLGEKLEKLEGWGGQTDDTDDGAFENCSKLPYIVIPASCYFIGRVVFSGCSCLQSIIYLGNLTGQYGSNATVYHAKNQVHWSNTEYDYQGMAPETVYFSCNMPAGFVPTEASFLGDMEKDVGTYTLNALFTFSNADMSFNITVPYTYTIKPITLTAKVEDASRIYGDANPQFSSTYTGFVNDEDASVITSHGNYTTATEKSDVGAYPIKQSGATAKNYTISYEDGTLTVNKAPLTMTANDKTMTYGSTVPTLDVTYPGLKNNETIPAWTTAPTITTTATKTSKVGFYPITISGAEAKNYDLTIHNGMLTVEKAPLTAKVDNKSRLYGDTNPEFTLTFNGLKNGETVPEWEQQPSFETTATTKSNVGTYPVTLKNAVAFNYDITPIDGTLTVNKAPLKVIPKDVTRKYGEQNPAFELLYEGLRNSENQPEWTVEPVITTNATQGSSAGEYAIQVMSGEARNYTLEKANGKLTITKAPLTIRLKDATRKYGMQNPNFEMEYTGLVNDETTPAWTSYPTITTTAHQSSDVGEYPITAEGGELKNYEADGITPAVLTVTPASLLIKAQDASKAYYDKNPQLNFTCMGFAAGDNPTSFSSMPILTTTATQESPVGLYPIEVSGAEIKNYQLSYEKGQLEVTPRTLTVSTNDYTRAYGEENPAFELHYKGFVNNEDEDVLLMKPKASTTATKDSDTGIYDITIGNGTAENYIFTYVGGKLTIEKAYQTMMWDQRLDSIALYDQVELTATASSGLPVKYTLQDNNVCSIVQIGSKQFLDCYGNGEAVISAIQEGNRNWWQTTKKYKTIKIGAAVGISQVMAETDGTEQVFDLKGRRIGKLQRGVNIVRQADGSIRKVFVK